MRPFTEGIYLKYSQLEHVEPIDEVQHPIIREALRLTGFRTPQIEITTLADIPAGTGLGSSGSFTTALLKALYTHRRRHLIQLELAELACHIEIDRLGEPIGKQDQYIAAFGGITCFTFHPDGSVTVEAAGDQHGHAVRPRRQSAAVLHRLFAQRRLHPARTRTRGPSRTTATCSTTCTTSRSSATQPARRSKRATPRLRRADARALGAQEAPLRRHEQSARSTNGTTWA